MKHCLLTLLSICLFGFLFAQNQAPVISNLSVNHNPGTQSVIFSFDVADNENDPLDLQLRISADSGRTWLVALDSIVGDTGFPISAGTGKIITWVYDPLDLIAQSNSGLVAFQGRVVADDRIGIDIQAIVDQVDSSRVMERLATLQGVRNNISNPTRMAEVRDSMENWMAASGAQDWHHSWSQFTVNDRNLSMRLSGLTRERKTWMASGHYDTVNAPGADDNGTGTVGTLEALEILSQYLFAESVRFVCFDLEEAGLRGSQYYVNNEVPDWEDLRGLLNMEMIGYKDTAQNTQALPFGFDILFPDAYQAVANDAFRGNFLTNVANTNSDPLKIAFDSCAATYVPGLRVISLAVAGNGQIAPDLRRSDHAPFWDAGYQALMLTDGADLRNPHYHNAGDTIGTLDPAFLVQNIKAVVATLAKSAQPMHADVAVGSSFEIDVPVGLISPNGDIRVYPNPARDQVRVQLANSFATPIPMEIWDLQGRLVRQLTVNAGGKMLIWDTRNAQGQLVNNGQYWLRLQLPGALVVLPVQILR